MNTSGSVHPRAGGGEFQGSVRTFVNDLPAPSLPAGRYDRWVMDEPVIELSDAEKRRVWDRFYEKFSFQPSMSPSKWPAIKEPGASVTWSLATLPDEPDYERLDRLVAVVEQDCPPALARRALCSPSTGSTRRTASHRKRWAVLDNRPGR